MLKMKIQGGVVLVKNKNRLGGVVVVENKNRWGGVIVKNEKKRGKYLALHERQQGKNSGIWNIIYP